MLTAQFGSFFRSETASLKWPYKSDMYQCKCSVDAHFVIIRPMRQQNATNITIVQQNRQLCVEKGAQNSQWQNENVFEVINMCLPVRSSTKYHKCRTISGYLYLQRLHETESFTKSFSQMQVVIQHTHWLNLSPSLLSGSIFVTSASLAQSVVMGGLFFLFSKTVGLRCCGREHNRPASRPMEAAPLNHIKFTEQEKHSL